MGASRVTTVVAAVAIGGCGGSVQDRASDGDGGDAAVAPNVGSPIDASADTDRPRKTFDVWDRVFDRPAGWWYSDGALTTELPGDRNLWIFGDTWIRHSSHLLFNSIAVQSRADATPPDDGAIRFFGRSATGEIVDITEEGGDATRPWAESPLREGWLWPGEPAVIDGILSSIFVEVVCVQEDFPKCRGFMGNMGIAGYQLVRVTNPERPPEEWNATTTPLLDARGESPAARRTHWGSTLFEHEGWVYVFGVGFDPGWIPTDAIQPDDIRSDAKVARTRPEDLPYYDRWQFLTRTGWHEVPDGPFAEDLVTIATDVPPEYSVDPVTRDGETRYLMVHAVIPSSELAVRVSLGDMPESLHWDDQHLGPHTWRGSLVEVDPALGDGMTWAGRAHAQLSQLPDELLVSYFSEKVHRLRFISFPLHGLRPWCDGSTAGSCWH